MIISLIAAVDKKGGIGRQNQLPWHLSSDLKRFKALTMGHHIVMGKKTYQTIGRPLPGRQTIIITHSHDYHPEGCLTVNSLDEAISHAQSSGESELFIIGGGEIFQQALPITEKIYLTVVHADVSADTFFPPLEAANWILVNNEAYPQKDKDEYASEFRILIRNTESWVDKNVNPHIMGQTK